MRRSKPRQVHDARPTCANRPQRLPKFKLQEHELLQGRPAKIWLLQDFKLGQSHLWHPNKLGACCRRQYKVLQNLRLWHVFLTPCSWRDYSRASIPPLKISNQSSELSCWLWLKQVGGKTTTHLFWRPEATNKWGSHSIFIGDACSSFFRTSRLGRSCWWWYSHRWFLLRLIPS